MKTRCRLTMTQWGVAVLLVFLPMLTLAKVPPDPQHELMEAAANGDLRRVTSLVAGAVNINAKDRAGQTALMRAAAKGRLEVVRLLVEKGADINASDSDGRTALWHAQGSTCADVAGYLRGQGAK